MLVAGSHPTPNSMEDLLGRDLIARLDRLDVVSRRVFAGKLPGERRSKRRGRSIEFDDHRPYTAGDDPRHLDWNLLARLDRLVIKLFREDEDLALVLLIDASPSMHAGAPGEITKLTAACRLAMALGYVGLVNNNRVSAAVFGAHNAGGPTLRRLPAMRGRRHVARLSQFVIDTASTPLAPPGSEPMPMREATRALARTSSGAGVLIVVSDFLSEPDYAPALNYAVGPTAAGPAFDVHAMQVVDPGELDPAVHAERGLSGDLRLIDAETGRAREVTISPALLRRYRQRLDAHQAKLARDCAARGIGRTLCTTADDPAQIVLSDLTASGVLGA